MLLNTLGKNENKPNPVIFISSEKKDDEQLFCVKDNGIGIPENNFKKIFKIFDRGNFYEEDISKGSGIGLSTCKKIVLIHKGKIWVESVIGRGSTFYFTIPCKKQ